MIEYLGQKLQRLVLEKGKEELKKLTLKYKKKKAITPSYIQIVRTVLAKLQPNDFLSNCYKIAFEVEPELLSNVKILKVQLQRLEYLTKIGYKTTKKK